MRHSFTASLAGEHETTTGDGREHTLQQIISDISGARTHAELAATCDAIADELRDNQVALLPPSGKDEVHRVGDGALGIVAPSHGATATLAERRLMHIVASDPTADPLELAALTARGWRSMLRLPLVWQGDVVGILEAYSRNDQPWSRFDIRRARMLSHQLGAALESIARRAQEREILT